MKSALALSLPLILAAVAARAEVPSVVTDIPPVHSLVAKVMGDLGAPDLLVGGGSDPHSYQLRPSQAARLADASLVFWIGHEMTPWLERALEAGSGAKAIALLDLPVTRTRIYGAHEEGQEGGHAEGYETEGHEAEGQDHAAEEHDNEAEAEHSHSGTDPHAWLDPANARAWVEVIRYELSLADPDNAAVYAANADKALANLMALEAGIADRLTGVRAIPIIVGHDAYGYFADHFGLAIAGSMEAGDAADPGAGHVSDLAALAAENGVHCLFPEAAHDPARMEALAADTGLTIGAALDPEGLMIDPGPGLYDALLTRMAEAIAACNRP